MFSKYKKPDNTRQRSRAGDAKPRQAFFSYYASQQPKETNSRPVRSRIGVDKTKKVTWSHIPFLFAGITLIVCLLYTTLLSNDVKLLKVNRETKLLREDDVYIEVANKTLSESIWNKTKLTIDTAKFEKQMKQQFPELSRAAVSLPLIGKRPVIELVSEKPALFLATEKGVYVVDTNGKAVARVNEIKGAGELALPTVRDEANVKIELGKGAMSSQDVTFITTLVKEFDAKKLTINSIVFPPLASELRIKIDGANYYIKFSLLTDPRIASGQYFAVKKKLDNDGITPAEYVDSRVEEKIYYK